MAGNRIPRIHRAAIGANVGNMGVLSPLGSAQLDAIAGVLAGVRPPTGTDGASLYAGACAGCHGAI